jgi:SAM-dependent methyltransferase
VDVETFAWILSAPGQGLLGTAAQVYADAEGDPVKVAAGIRRHESDTARASAAAAIITERVRGVAKFGEDALAMYFTSEALEQATRPEVANHRAARLAAAQVGTVIDLGCGIGSDLIAFARAGLTAAGVDQDPLRVAMTQANLSALGLPGATGVAAAEEVDSATFGAAFVDPARRNARGRTFRLDDWSPAWEFVRRLLASRAVAKVAPGFPHEEIPAGVEAEWVSYRGEVKEAALWSPGLATCERRATVIGRGGLATMTEEDDPFDRLDPPVAAVGEFLYEPDGAVIRAGLVTAVAAGVQGALLDQHIAYVTSAASYRTPFAKGYRVLEELPYREKQLKLALKQRGIGRLTIKKRGVEIDPAALRKRLSLAGDNEGTLVLTRASGIGTALLVEPF